jgi:amino acid permease
MEKWNFGFPCGSDLAIETPALTASRIKVLALIVFFILAICISAGAVGPQTIGFKYWHQPGAFADGINGVAKTFVVAGTLYAGTEMYAFKLIGLFMTDGI